MKQTYNLKPASAILTTIFLLFGILVVSMIGIQIVMNGLAARRAQGASSKAFYASESGMERALNMYKNYASSIMENGDCNTTPKKLNLFAVDNFCDGIDQNNYSVGGGAGSDVAMYWVKGSKLDQNVFLNARGTFSGTNRELYVSFCLPDCPQNPQPGDLDGCGHLCN